MSHRNLNSNQFELTQFIDEHNTTGSWTKQDVDFRTEKKIDVIISYIRSGIDGNDGGLV